MMRGRRRGYPRKSLRGALYFQLFSFLFLLVVCLAASQKLGVWRVVVSEKRITLSGVISIAVMAICIANLVFVARTVLKTILDLEKAVNVLQSAAACDLAEAEMLDSGHYSLTELLQILLQREATAQIMTKQAEINALQNQINPHFLYNTLETIRGQALCSGEAQIAVYLHES